MKDVSLAVQRQVFFTDNWTCVYCGYRGSDVTMDHIDPRVKGGGHTFDNLYTACQPCNSRKGGRTPKEASMVPCYGRFARPTLAPEPVTVVQVPPPAPPARQRMRPAPQFAVRHSPLPRAAAAPIPTASPDRTLGDIFGIALVDAPKRVAWRVWVCAVALAILLLALGSQGRNNAELLRRWAPQQAPIHAEAVPQP